MIMSPPQKKIKSLSHKYFKLLAKKLDNKHSYVLLHFKSDEKKVLHKMTGPSNIVTSQNN